MNTLTKTMQANVTNDLVETFNQEAINQNIKPVADFFRLHGDKTISIYSNIIMEMMETAFN